MTAPEIAACLYPDDGDSIAEVADLVSRYDIVFLQHEFGIYGPDDGLAALDLVERLTAPLIVTMHTVSADLSPGQTEILMGLGRRAEMIVVHSSAAKNILQQVYELPSWRISVIPHGADAVAGRPGRHLLADDDEHRPLLLTWGLIGPSKGLEWAVRAVDNLVRATYPDIHYVIAGGTHPKVAAIEGEAYRESITGLIHRLDLSSHVTMVDHYLGDGELADLIGRASAVVLPYESTDQTSSGVLAKAVISGVPVVATAFPHAVEMEGQGVVLTVPHRDSTALSAMIHRVLSDGALVADMLAAQSNLAGVTSWEQVGARYRDLSISILAGVGS